MNIKMKKIQLCYRDEVKPPIIVLVFKLCLYKFTRDVLRTWSEKKKVYRKALATRASLLKNGTKYKGRIIETDIKIRKEDYNPDNISFKTKYDYYATIEYKNNEGDIIHFKTPPLNANAEFITTKKVTVYAFNSVNYATDFGFIKV